MARARNHYDNLKVAQNAPPEVIKAAYKVLCQKYHPDLNGDTPRNLRAMQIINQAYSTLSDPIKRKEHDAWILRKQIEQEQEYGRENEGKPEPLKQNDPPQAKPPQPNYNNQHQKKKDGINFYAFIPLIVILIYTAIDSWQSYEKKIKARARQTSAPSQIYIPPTSYPSANKNQTLNSEANTKGISREEFMRRLDEIDKAKQAEQEKDTYTKPITAPNGVPWPKKASYVEKYPILMNDGLSRVTIDNIRNNSDVFVKLFRYTDTSKQKPIRTIYIPAFNIFTINNVRAGTYDVRYQDLDNGGFSKTEKFTLEETPTYSGVQYSTVTLTLYKIQNGNMQIEGITLGDFE